MMTVSIVDRILSRKSERQREETERQRRQQAAIAAVRALPIDERLDVLAELIDLEESSSGTTVPRRRATKGTLARGAKTAARSSSKTVSDSVMPLQSRASHGQKFIDKAERFVQAHPEGVTTAEVAHAIGQEKINADGTLRLIVKTRRTVKRLERKWFPVSFDDVDNFDPAKRLTIRSLVVRVLTKSEAALGAADIFRELESIMKGVRRASLDAELSRMKKDGLVVVAGVGANGGGIYTLVRPNTDSPNEGESNDSH